MIPVQEIGGFHPMDADGFLLNDADASRIVFPWSHAAGAIRDALLEMEGEGLAAVFVRGSVAQGTAQFGVSDIDAVGVTRGPPARTDVGAVERALHGRFPFCSGVEIVRVQRDSVAPGSDSPRIRFSLAVSGAPVWGEDIRPLLPRYRPGREIAFHAPSLRKRHEWFLANAGGNGIPASRWLAKSIVRAGFDLVVERERRWTPHVRLCWERFSEHHPEWRDRMRRMLDAVVNPDARAVAAGAPELVDFVEREWARG